MDNCPICSCFMTNSKCVICGYKKDESNKNNTKNTSVFDIFDFIDGKNNDYIPKSNINKNSMLEKNDEVLENIKSNPLNEKYEEETYKQIKYENNNKKQPIDTTTKSIKTKNINTKKNIKIPFLVILSIILGLIDSKFIFLVIILEAIIENASKNKSKK